MKLGKIVWGTLVDTKFDMSQQCVPANKKGERYSGLQEEECCQKLEEGFSCLQLKAAFDNEGIALVNPTLKSFACLRV